MLQADESQRETSEFIEDNQMSRIPGPTLPHACKPHPKGTLAQGQASRPAGRIPRVLPAGRMDRRSSATIWPTTAYLLACSLNRPDAVLEILAIDGTGHEQRCAAFACQRRQFGGHGRRHRNSRRFLEFRRSTANDSNRTAIAGLRRFDRDAGPRNLEAAKLIYDQYLTPTDTQA